MNWEVLGNKLSEQPMSLVLLFTFICLHNASVQMCDVRYDINEASPIIIVSTKDGFF